MKVAEIQKSFYDIFNFIYTYEDIFKKKNIKKRKYKINKEDRYILKKMYNAYNLYKYQITFRDFKKISINLTLINKENLLVSATKIVETLDKKTK